MLKGPCLPPAGSLQGFALLQGFSAFRYFLASFLEGLQRRNRLRMLGVAAVFFGLDPQPESCGLAPKKC